MSAPTIACVGNAVVDAIVGPSHAPPSRMDLDRLRLAGRDARSEHLSAAYDTVATWIPGGSAANTAAELARLGSRTTFVGRVRDDALGRGFMAGLADAGAETLVAPRPEGAPTSRIYVFVDAEAERTFAEALGASDDLCAGDVETLLGRALSAMHVEAYLLDRPAPAGAFEAAMSLADVTGAVGSVTLGSPSCAARHRARLLAVAEDEGHVLIGNEAEFSSLMEVPPGDALVRAILALDATCVMTLGGAGAVATLRGTVTECPAYPVERIVDTTGAGDAFAAGFLSLHVTDAHLMASLERASRCGADAVQRVGARG